MNPVFSFIVIATGLHARGHHDTEFRSPGDHLTMHLEDVTDLPVASCLVGKRSFTTTSPAY
jgi:hypothetical protein